MKELFDVKYVHEQQYDKEVIGKNCIVADTLLGLARLVNDPDRAMDSALTVVNTDSTLLPFITKDDISWKYAYYDPNYAVKVAWRKDKKIEYRKGNQNWVYWVLSEEPDWDDFEWRIKPEREYKVGDVVNIDGLECMIISRDVKEGKYFAGGAWRYADELGEVVVDTRSIYTREHE